MAAKWTTFLFRSLDPGRPLDARSILARGCWDFTVIGALFLLLVRITMALRAAPESLKDSRIHHFVLQGLEYVIFFCGSVFILLAVVYLQVILVWDLWRSFRRTIQESPLPARDEEPGVLVGDMARGAVLPPE